MDFKLPNTIKRITPFADCNNQVKNINLVIKLCFRKRQVEEWEQPKREWEQPTNFRRVKVVPKEMIVYRLTTWK